MSKLKISSENLTLVSYEGAGNRTPVLDLHHIAGISKRTPQDVRKYLQDHAPFRKWLQNKGKQSKADSIMLFYKAEDAPYDFVTFVGEPNASAASRFSDMCGNGIRCLALHILLSEPDKKIRDVYLHNGISIWAGTPKKIRFESFDIANTSALVAVEMGKFQTHRERLISYVNPRIFSEKIYDSVLLPAEFIPRVLQKKKFGIGYNGENEGEPHLVLLLDDKEFNVVCEKLNINTTNQITSLRKLTALLGNELTFNTNLFPQGINLNIGIVAKDQIVMATHERNLLPNKKSCTDEQAAHVLCRCCTLACGTGGAAVANIAVKQKIMSLKNILTIHPGGDIQYVVGIDNTTMIGPAKKI